MKSVLFLTVAISTVAANEFAFDGEWKLWKTEHMKHYRSYDEEIRRRAVWLKNKELIDIHNIHSDERGFTMAMNSFGDLTMDEYRTIYLDGSKQMQTLQDTMASELIVDMSMIPTAVDWRKRGLVTAVKNQGRCKSSYAFAAVGALEAANVADGSSITALSEQSIIDCSVPFGNFGCNGGDVARAMNFVIENGVISTEAGYPYVEHQYLCEYNKTTVPIFVSRVIKIASNSESALMAAVANVGPIAVTIDASSFDFMFYEGGIFSGSCSNSTINHSVLVIGYGISYGKEYWLLKNSWGTNWGINGYAMIARNNNCCGIASDALYPI